MSKLKQLSKIKLAFLEFMVYGVGDELANEIQLPDDKIDFEPLVIVGTPPDSSFVIESKMMSQFLTTHISDFSKYVDKLKATTDTKLKDKMMKEMEREMEDSTMKEFTNPAEVFTKTITLAKEYLTKHTEYCYYPSNPQERVNLRFTLTEHEREEVLQDIHHPKDTEVLCINILTQDELALIGTHLLEGKSKRTPVANVPVKTDEKGGESSVPADKLANFPVALGRNVLSNVPPKRDSDS